MFRTLNCFRSALRYASMQVCQYASMQVWIFSKTPKTVLLISQQPNIAQRPFCIQNELHDILYHLACLWHLPQPLKVMAVPAQLWSLCKMIEDVLPFVLNTKRPLSNIWLLRYKQNSFAMVCYNIWLFQPYLVITGYFLLHLVITSYNW